MSSESSHFYTREGQAMHTQPTKSPGAKNPTRNTTIADARRLNLLPSVSGIVRMMSAPGLERYKQNRIIEECYKRPPIGPETVREYSSYIMDVAERPTSDAANFGTKVHKAIEDAIGGVMPKPGELVVFPSTGEETSTATIVENVLDLLSQKGVNPTASETVLTHQAGYAGTTDLIGVRSGLTFLGDFKTKKTKPGAQIDVPESYCMQLAAYYQAKCDMEGLGEMPFTGPLANVFISSTEPGRIEWHEWSPKELTNAWSAFRACFTLWKWSNNYDPQFTRA